MRLVMPSVPVLTLEVEGKVFSRGSNRVAGEIKQALRSSGYLALSRVNVAVSADEIVLRGTLPTYHLKQLAQEVALRAAQSKRVNNEIDVREWGP